MLIIEHIPSVSSAADRLERRAVVLTWEERRKSRQKVTTRTGMEIGLALPTGTVLKDGDVLYVGEDFCIVVEAAEEEVIAFYPRTPHEWARAGFELGNRHLAVSVDGDAIMSPFDPGTMVLGKALGIPYERKCVIFEPLKAAGHHVHHA